jgi:hypothetical protein
MLDANIAVKCVFQRDNSKAAFACAMILKLWRLQCVKRRQGFFCKASVGKRDGRDSASTFPILMVGQLNAKNKNWNFRLVTASVLLLRSCQRELDLWKGHPIRVPCRHDFPDIVMTKILVLPALLVVCLIHSPNRLPVLTSMTFRRPFADSLSCHDLKRVDLAAFWSCL